MFDIAEKKSCAKIRQEAIMDFPYIRAWAKHTNKPEGWLEAEIARAAIDKVPDIAICRDGFGRWLTIYSVESSQQRHILDRLAQE